MGSHDCRDESLQGLGHVPNESMVAKTTCHGLPAHGRDKRVQEAQPPMVDDASGKLAALMAEL